MNPSSDLCNGAEDGQKAVWRTVFPTNMAALHHIQPGKSQQNACVEREIRTVRHEWLGLYISKPPRMRRKSQ